jgi:hypothetical protein
MVVVKGLWRELNFSSGLAIIRCPSEVRVSSTAALSQCPLHFPLALARAITKPGQLEIKVANRWPTVPTRLRQLQFGNLRIEFYEITCWFRQNPTLKRTNKRRNMDGERINRH